MHQVHTLNPGCAPTTHALRPGLCACSAFYMPQYSRAYCVPAQPSICHNTLWCITIQLLQQPCSLCHDTINCIVTLADKLSSLSHNTVCCLAIQFPNQQASAPVTIHFSVLQYKCPAAKPSLISYHNTLSVL